MPPPDGFASWDDFDRSLPPERQGTAFTCTAPTGVGPRLFFQRVPEGNEFCLDQALMRTTARGPGSPW